MHSFLQRANALLTFAGTVLACLCISATVSDVFHTSNPVVIVEYLGTESLEKTSRGDKTNLLLSLEADLRSEFTWNTKQLYIHVDIDFATPNTPINSVVMWNAIVQLKKNAVFKIEELRAMRPFIVTDLDNSLPGTPFNVTVEWEVMPKVGRVYYRSKTFSGFRFPDEYHKLKKISN